MLGYMVVQGKGEAHLAAGGALSVLLEEALPALFPDAAAEAFDKVSTYETVKTHIRQSHGTYKTVKARFWPWLSGKSP